MHTHAFPNRLYAGCVRVSIVPLLVVVVPVLVAAVFGQLLLFLCHPYLNPLDKRRRQEECVGSGYNKKKRYATPMGTREGLVYHKRYCARAVM